MFLSVSLSAILSALIYFFAPWIAHTFLKEARTTDLLRLMCVAIIPSSVHACFNGYYYGKKNAVPPALCQIIEQLARVFSTFLIYQVLQEEERSLFLSLP